MRYRKLDANDDMQFGHGLKDFYIDVPEAPAQAVRTRLQLSRGEWYLNLLSGTPWKTEVLGKYTGSTRDITIRSRVLGTQGVTDIVEYGSSFNQDTRGWQVNMTINTAYGQTSVVAPL
jgi:hypothetical protein